MSNTVLREYPISTSKYGIGNKEGSGKTPLGKHRIVKKVGMGEPIGTVFRNLRKTGEIATIYYDSTDIESDPVITRVLVLEGLEKGVNKGRGIDSLSRGIYIHGTHEEGLIGKPASHGCIRMRNKDIMELFELVDIGTLVVIEN
ncbi:MAG: L,D-transpeptidase [Brevinematia bacterium]